MKITFQGEPGAYSHEAILAHWGNVCEVLPARSVRDVFVHVACGEADRGLLPIENALTGSIHEVYDLLLDYELSITGEVYWGIRHALLGIPGARADRIEHVYSHPQALWQCETYLDGLRVERHASYDTAGAARWVSEQGDRTTAAIAGKLAARLYGLQILAANIATLPHNTTRFIVIGGSPGEAATERRSKTSLVVELTHDPGALYRALEPFAEREINLTKLESRPVRTKPWNYRFYLDFEGCIDEPSIRDALSQLSGRVSSCRVLGSYPQGGEHED